MSQWQSGDGFRSGSPQQSQELLQSWSGKEEGNTSAECWAPHASSFHFDANTYPFSGRAQNAHETPLAARFEPVREEHPLAARLEISQHENIEHRSLREVAQSSNNVADSSPLSRIYDILDVQSPSSRWLEQRGYLEAFKSPNCMLDLTFGTDKGGSKVGAVMTAPDGTKRTVVACEGGATFQRLTASNGQELVKFLSSGQIVELNPKTAQFA
jgi:hypothetical protein